jgi:hypothetical protein
MKKLDWRFIWEEAKAGLWLAGICLIFLALLVAVIGSVLYSIGRMAGPHVERTENIVRAKNIADTMGKPDREGYGDKTFDEHDQKLLFEALDVPLNSKFDDIPSLRIDDFLRKQGEKVETSEGESGGLQPGKEVQPHS